MVLWGLGLVKLRDHEKLLKVLNSPLLVEGTKKIGDILIVTAPAWAWIVFHPLAWEVDKKYPGTGLGFNTVYGIWVGTQVMSQLGGIGSVLGGIAAMRAPTPTK